MSSTTPLARLRWMRSVRIVSEGHDPIALFESISDPGEIDAVLAVRAFTDTYARDLLGRLEQIEPNCRLAGRGSTDATTPFLFYPPEGSRFTDGSFGIYYAAQDRATSISETVFHKARWLSSTAQASTEVLMRVLHGSHDISVVDIRGQHASKPDLYEDDPTRYIASQRFGLAMRATGKNGIVYDSVRHTGGQCVALFHPKAVGPIERGELLSYIWSGKESRIVDVRVINSLPLP